MKGCVIGINFCGGCNPVIDRSAIAREISAALTEAGFEVAFNDWDADFIIRLSGCSANCAERYHPEAETGLSIAGLSLDAVFAAEDDLAGLAVAAVEAYYRSESGASRRSA